MFHLCKSGIKIRRIPNLVNIVSFSEIFCNHNHRKHIRHFCHEILNSEKYRNFKDVIIARREEANQSILVQVNSEQSFSELHSYCSQYGNIKGAHHYILPHDELHYILIEFSNCNEANTAISSSTFNDNVSGVPVRSPFLWFRAGSKQKTNKKNNTAIHSRLVIEDGIRVPSKEDVISLLQSAETVENQILILQRSTCLNDLGTRLRFLAARQVEMCFSGMFPNANAFPFGSSVNGFGKLGCDLDLILRFNDSTYEEKSSSRLVFHTKANLTNGRSQTQRQMESISDMFQLFIPGVCHVRRILQARVPIIKYNHEHMDLEVDLSMSNMTGVYMSELLYMFGEIDKRVRPLTFCIRSWAQSVGLTNPSPGRWISNFSLTMLVVFFLQQLPRPILPTVNFLIQNSRKEDFRETEDQINCSFLRDLNQLKFKVKNIDSIENLLLQFFEYYSQFDFHNKSISLNEGRSLLKPDHSAMYIINPLEGNLNVSKNVSFEETERFRIEIRNAAWILESEIQRHEDTPWGILNLFKSNKDNIVKPQAFFKPRMVDVKELFQGDNDYEKIQGYGEEPEYKTNALKSQIEKIKSKAKLDLRQIKDYGHSSGNSSLSFRSRRR